MDPAIAFLVDRNVDDHRLLVAAGAEVVAIVNQDELYSSDLCCVQAYASQCGRDPAFHVSLSTVMVERACWLDRRAYILQ